MSSRLADLQHQRDLLQQHLAWLDQEIAKEQGVAPSGETTPCAPSTADARHTAASAATPDTAMPPPLPLRVPAGSTAGADAEEILQRYQQDAQTVHQDTRKGCLVAAAVTATALIIAALLAYSLYARHLGRWW